MLRVHKATPWDWLLGNGGRLQGSSVLRPKATPLGTLEPAKKTRSPWGGCGLMSAPRPLPAPPPGGCARPLPAPPPLPHLQLSSTGTEFLGSRQPAPSATPSFNPVQASRDWPLLSAPTPHCFVAGADTSHSSPPESARCNRFQHF